MKSIMMLLAALTGVGPLCFAPASGQDLAITGVTVVDTRSGALLPDRTIIVHSGRIAEIRLSVGRLPLGTQRISGRGRFLTPGLWDMETHLSWARDCALSVLVANGVTGVRDLGGDLVETADWARQIAAGTLVGPTIRQVGPMLNGKSFNRYQFALESPEAARGIVRLLKFEGVDALEIERRVPRDVYFALIDEAKRANLPLTGHIPLEVSPEEASDAGQSTIDNLETIYDGTFRVAHEPDLPSGIDTFLAPDGGADALFGMFRRNGTAVTPVVAIFDYTVRHSQPNAPPDPNERYVAASDRKPPATIPTAQLTALRAEYPQLLKTVARLQAAGVTLLAGTDLAGSRVPGFSLHDELETLVESGLSAIEALRTATLNAAVVMNVANDYGTVEPGRIADLMLLDADPTQDISATRRIAAMVLHGRLLDKPALDRLLVEGQRLAATE